MNPSVTHPTPELARRMANALRMLAVDAVEQARSGHPGAPMGMAEIAEVLKISIPALKSRLHRARLHVRQRLAEVSRPAARTTPREAAI